MSRRLTGCLLAAALIGAGTTTTLSSERLNRHQDRDIEPAGPLLVDADKGYIDCAEILISRNPLILQDGKVLLLQPGMTSADLNRVTLLDIMIGNADQRVLDEFVRAPGGRLDPLKLTWPSLPAGELLPDGKKPRDLIGAACGIPAGVTLFLPSEGLPHHQTHGAM